MWTCRDGSEGRSLSASYKCEGLVPPAGLPEHVSPKAHPDEKPYRLHGSDRVTSHQARSSEAGLRPGEQAEPDRQHLPLGVSGLAGDDADRTGDLDLIDFVQESVIACDLTGRIVGWNAAAERLYGWDRRAALGQCVDLLGDQAPLAAAKRANTLQSTDRWVGDLIRKTADGNTIIVQVKVSLRRDRHGNPIGLVETGTDVTDQRQTEEALKVSDRRYRNLFHAMPASFWEIDFSRPRQMLNELMASGVEDLASYLAEHHDYVRVLMQATKVLNVNDRSVELYRLRSRDDLPDGVHHYWPDHCTHVFARSVVAAVNDEPFFASETKQLTLDGHEFDALFTASYPPEMTAQGRLIVNIVDNSDIKKGQAALREREAFYRNVFHASTISTWHLDASGARRYYSNLKAQGVTDIPAYAGSHPEFIHDIQKLLTVTDVNDTTLKLFGAQDRNDIVGGSVTPFWIPGHYETLLGSIAASYNNAERFRGETRMRTLDGREIHVLFTVSASQELRAAGQALLGIVDITDRVRAENALTEMQTNYAHAARVSLLGELTASIAHEVNQPLAAITTNGEAGLRWLNQPVLDVEELRLLTKDMISDARRASDIIVRIRAMAMPQPPTYQRLSLNSLVQEAVLFLGPQLKKRDVEQAQCLQSDLPEVSGDPVQLQQVVVNLVLNAVQAMEPTPAPRLELHTSVFDSQYVRLEVVDNGPGVPTRDAERLFDTFFTTKSAGMGIGLSICRSILQAHGGSINFTNDKASGARLTVLLPIAP